LPRLRFGGLGGVFFKIEETCHHLRVLGADDLVSIFTSNQ
jgi:hypothetical protein